MGPDNLVTRLCLVISILQILNFFFQKKNEIPVMDRLNFLLIATFAFLMDKQYKRANLK